MVGSSNQHTTYLLQKKKLTNLFYGKKKGLNKNEILIKTIIYHKNRDE